MNGLLQKLERKAGQWLAIMDDQLNQPIVQTVTGEVFTHETGTQRIDVPYSPADVAQPSDGDDPQGHPYQPTTARTRAIAPLTTSRESA